MDPLGFAMENFDAVGQWRTRAESGEALDVSHVQMARYLGAADYALRQAVATRPPGPVATVVLQQ